jgi:hypothetical protein
VIRQGFPQVAILNLPRIGYQEGFFCSGRMRQAVFHNVVNGEQHLKA